jgi:Nucleotidyl transferase AbiEii toxin, Type IV TA system
LPFPGSPESISCEMPAIVAKMVQESHKGSGLLLTILYKTVYYRNQVITTVPSMYNEKKIKKSELLQLILLDNLYAQSGSDRIIFQGGTALRWVYGGMRFSEDLDFVTDLPKEDVENILAGAFQKTQMACIAQFGPGKSEHQRKSGRKEAIRMFFIYRPETQRERIAVKLEFEFLAPGRKPRFQKKQPQRGSRSGKNLLCIKLLLFRPEEYLTFNRGNLPQAS